MSFCFHWGRGGPKLKIKQEPTQQSLIFANLYMMPMESSPFFVLFNSWGKFLSIFPARANKMSQKFSSPVTILMLPSKLFSFRREDNEVACQITQHQPYITHWGGGGGRKTKTHHVFEFTIFLSFLYVLVYHENELRNGIYSFPARFTNHGRSSSSTGRQHLTRLLNQWDHCGG